MALLAARDARISGVKVSFDPYHSPGGECRPVLFQSLKTTHYMIYVKAVPAEMGKVLNPTGEQFKDCPTIFSAQYAMPLLATMIDYINSGRMKPDKQYAIIEMDSTGKVRRSSYVSGFNL
jgi:hypothetical protein